MRVCMGGCRSVVQVLTYSLSYLDTTRACVRDTQVIHLHSRAADGGGDAEGRQDVTWLGMGYWKEKTKDALRKNMMAWSDVR